MSVNEHKERVIGMLTRRVYSAPAARTAVEQLIAAVHAEYRDKVTALIDEHPVSPATRIALSRLYGGNHAFEPSPLPEPEPVSSPEPVTRDLLSAMLGVLADGSRRMRDPISVNNLHTLLIDVKRKLDDDTLTEEKVEFDT